MEKSISDKFIERSTITHNSKYSYLKVSYKNTNSKIIITCNIHGDFQQTPKNHQNGHGCTKCATSYKSSLLSKNISDFVSKSIKIHNNKYDYSKSVYVNNKTNLIVICPIHGDFKITPSHHYVGHGCQHCTKNHRKTNDEFIRLCEYTHGDKYFYNLVKFKSLKKNVVIICRIHGEFLQNAGHHVNGHGCPVCSSSHGERYIKEFLDINNIQYVREKTFEECNNIGKLRFDFYLPKYNICLEYDGIQHYKPIEYFGGVYDFEKRKYNDSIKDEFCKLNNIDLFRIKYLRPSIKNKERIFKLINKKINK